MAESPECSVCFGEQFVEPVSLSCGHLFCFPCLMETRESRIETARLCPHSLCQYDRALPVFLTGSLSMSEEQLRVWGPRKALDFEQTSPVSSQEVHLTPPSSPSISPRRSSRAAVANPRYFGSDMAQRPARGRGRGRRGRGSRGTQRSVQPGFLDDNSSDDDSRIQEENMPRSSGRGRGMARERIQALVDDTGLEGILGETGDTQDIENNIDDSRDDVEAVEDEISTRAVPDANSSRRPYFKGYRLIPGIQKTHDTAILEMALDYMTNRQKTLKTLNMTQVGRLIRERYEPSFPNISATEVSKHVKRSLDRSLLSYKQKEARVGRSGQTGPENSPDEQLASQILALDASLRLNIGIIQTSTSTRQNIQIDRIMAPQERQDAVSELNLNSPVIVNRVRQRASQEGGREVRESSLAAHVRRGRDGHPRLESSLSNLVETASNNARSSSRDFSATMSENAEERMIFRERRMEEDLRQRELDREAKERDKERDRQLARENGLLFASIISKMIPGNAVSEGTISASIVPLVPASSLPVPGSSVSSVPGRSVSSVPGRSVSSVPGSSVSSVPVNYELVEFQYVPAESEGSQPFPLLVSLSTLTDLLRELRNYTQEMDVSGIVWEGATARPVVISALEQMEFNKGSPVLVKIIRKCGIRYFRLANS